MHTSRWCTPWTSSRHLSISWPSCLLSWFVLVGRNFFHRSSESGLFPQRLKRVNGPLNAPGPPSPYIRNVHCREFFRLDRSSFRCWISHHAVLGQCWISFKRNLRNLILEGLFINLLMLRFPPILAGRRNRMHGFHRPSKMTFLIFRLHWVASIV